MTTPKIATPKAVRTEAAGMSDSFLRCRDIGHQWRMYFQKKAGKGFERRLYCPSCKTARFVVINGYGEVVSNHYRYDTGYQLKGLGRVQGRAKSVLRLESISRTNDFEVDYTVFEEPDSLHNELAPAIPITH